MQNQNSKKVTLQNWSTGEEVKIPCVAIESLNYAWNFYVHDTEGNNLLTCAYAQRYWDIRNIEYLK